MYFKKRINIFCFILSALLFSSSLFAGDSLSYSSENVLVRLTNESFVKMLEENSIDAVLPGFTEVELLYSVKGEKSSYPAIKRWVTVAVPKKSTPHETITKLQKMDQVEVAELNKRVKLQLAPNDPDYDLLYALNNTEDNLGMPGADIDAERAWDITTGSRNVIVAVIDSGIDVGHEDLSANIWVNEDEIPGNGIDDDGNGYIDDIHGWDFMDNDNDIDPGFKTYNGKEDHGTHVAGTIGAVGNNGIGIAGVAWNVQLMGVRFTTGNTTEDPTALIDRVIQSIIYAVDNDAHIINASFGDYIDPVPAAVIDVFQYAEDKGVLIVCAAGNDGKDIDSNKFVPAGLDYDNILSVNSTNYNDIFYSSYNYGPTKVDVAAPGVSIQSTIPYSDYAKHSGTSMSAPHVSGVAALVFAQDINRTAVQVKQIIMDTVDPIPSLQGKNVTGGRVNAYNAVSYNNENPVISLIGSNNINVTIGEPYVEMGATAYDDQDGDISHFIEIGGDIVDTDTIGQYEVLYNVTDSDGNTATTVIRTVYVNPVVTCVEETATLVNHDQQNRAYTETTYLWWLPTTKYYAFGSGDYLGNSSTISVTLYSMTSSDDWYLGTCPGEDTTPPEITIIGDNPMVIDQGSVFTDPGVTAADNVDGDITDLVVIDGEVDTSVIGEYEITYSVEDAAGNASQETRVIEVVEAIQEWTGNLFAHENAGRAYSEKSGYWFWSITTWYAVGSEENLGTNGFISVTLIENPPGSGIYEKK